MYLTVFLACSVTGLTEADLDAPHLYPKDAENLSSLSSGSSRSTWTWTATPSFQLGSGAQLTSSNPLDTAVLVEAERLKPEPRFLSRTQSMTKAERPKSSTDIKREATHWLPPVLILSMIVLMMPTGQQNFNVGNRDFNYRIPLHGRQKVKPLIASEHT